MLGGSAPSQTSGAPYRTESGSRNTGWPSPAHQNDICSRHYGVYSLFPGPDDTPRTLYAPTAKSSHVSKFQDFVGAPKVPEEFLSTKFTFLPNGTPQFDSSSHPDEQEVSQLELKRKSFNQISKPLLPNTKNLEEQSVSVIKDSKLNRLNDAVVIKSEVEEGNKIENDNERLAIEQSGEVVSTGNKKLNTNEILPTETESLRIRIEYTLASEPDSTVFRTSNKIRKSEDVTTTEVDNSEKESISSLNEVGVCIGRNPVDCSDIKNAIENESNKDKCNNKVIDSMIENDGKKKKTEKFHLKVESVNDICSRLSKRKDLKAQDSNLKSSAATSKKLHNEPFKPSPNRTLSLSPHNGGCSRTTPVTFKQTSQEEVDPKPQNIHIEVPSLFIKKEPSDFQKNSSSTSFMSPTHSDTGFFSPGGMNILDGQLLSPLPYSNSFESSNRLKEMFSSPLDQNYLSPNQSFLSSRPSTETSFLNSNGNIARFVSYKDYPNFPKTDENYLMNGNDEKIGERVFLKSSECLLSGENQPEVTRVFVNSTTESKSKISENVAYSGSNITPCQVAEVTSASSLLSPNNSNVNPLVVKQETSAASSSGSTMGGAFNDTNKETAFMTSGQSTLVSSTVGVSSTRQRCQLRLNEVKMSSNNVSSPPVMHGPVQSPASIDLSSPSGAAAFTKGMVDDRSPHFITTWPAQTHSPALWQYSGPIDYPPFPPVGFQLVRDPVTGHFLLIPASNFEALQRAILWPSYQTTPPQMIIPPLSVQPSTPHLLLDANVPAVDFLTPEAIHHGASQHRILIASDNSTKRKVTTPAVIKLEASDCSSAPTVTACESENIYGRAPPLSLSPRKESVFLSQKTSGPNESERRSQATSPCINPVSENKTNQSDSKSLDSCQLQRITTVMLQDASNQTDLPFETENEASSVCRDKFIPYCRTTEQKIKMIKTQDVATETVLIREPEDDKSSVLIKIQEKEEAEESLNVNCANVPEHLIIKKEIFSPSQVDLSGLELLSNSIEQFVCDTKCTKIDMGLNNNLEKCASNEEQKNLSSDACEGAVLLHNLKNRFREVEENKTYKNKNSVNLGGLGLLCALAEQRFQEEIENEVENNEKNNLQLHEKINEIEDENEREVEENEEEEEEESEEENKQNVINDLESLEEKDPKKRDFENFQSESDVLSKLKKEICTEDEIQTSVPDKMLQNDEDDSSSSGLCGEKSVLKRGPGRPKKNKNIKKDINVLKPFFSCSVNRNSKEMSPPVLEKETDYSYKERDHLSQDSIATTSEEDILKPPTLIPSTILDPVIKTMAGTLELTPCEVSLIALKISRDKLKKGEKSDGETLSENESKKRKLSDCSDSFSSSKKRKVGRPKKHLLHQNPVTETIVAKKPKTKTYLFQPVQTVKNFNCLKINNNENGDCEKGEKKKNSLVSLEADAKNVSDSGEEDEKKLKKIRPKLKAEPKIKEGPKMQNDEILDVKKSVKKEDKQKIKTQKKLAIEQKIPNDITKDSILPSCVLRTEHLKNEIFPIRTLTAMGGLFYAGQLSAIRAPDVYGITIDGERGNRPHIYSREEILKDSILEIKPEKTSDLPPGTRCCAYWSEQYRCLYPGTVSAPVSPDPELDEKFVNVEFDDGDSGRIDIDDIRLLPEDYPVVEYDPNPLQSLSKRKRRISGTSLESHSKERKSVDSSPSPTKNENVSEKIYSGPKSMSEETETKEPIQIFESESFLSLESERKHLKKKRREKLKRLQSLSIEGKKKHKKHKCSDEHRHHRHHKKHKKHKHKHGKKHGDEIKREVKKGDDKISSKEKLEPILRKKNTNKCKSVEKSCKLSDKSKAIKPKKCKERTDSVESRSKIAAFLPARQLWGWSGKGYRRPGAKGRARKEFYKTIQRGKERITVGDCAVFLSTGRPDRPYIGRIESMWESWGTNMIVRVKWFYHPEETVGCPPTLEYPGALFESPHVDENDVQTISHKCEVLPLKEYNAKIGNDPQRYETIYDNNDIYYLAGYYDPTNTTLKMEPGVK